MYSLARDSAFTPRNIKSGWCKAGLYPFNPDRVLNSTHKPQGEVIDPQIANTNTELVSYHNLMRTPVTWEDNQDFWYGLFHEDVGNAPA